jgi:hypothetical protein
MIGHHHGVAGRRGAGRERWHEPSAVVAALAAAGGGQAETDGEPDGETGDETPDAEA